MNISKRATKKVLVSLLLSSSLNAKTPAFKHRYITRFQAIAVKEMERSGIPASITLAQGILESGWGKSPLSLSSNNHFGIKCHADWVGRKHLTHSESSAEVVKTTCYRAYTKAETSYKDHTEFILKNALYQPLFGSKDYKDWAKGLEKVGYAQDDLYAERLINVIEDNELHRFDIVLETELSVAEVKNLPLHELLQMIRFGLYGNPAKLEAPIIEGEWSELSKIEKRWFDMDLQPITFNTEKRRKKGKKVKSLEDILWI